MTSEKISQKIPQKLITKKIIHKFHRYSLTSIAVILFIVSLFTIHAIAQSKEPASSPIFPLTNKERISHNLKPLTYNTKLEQAAYAKAMDMLNDQYFDHYSKDGRTPWQFINETGYDYAYAGENLAMDFSDPTLAQKAWMKSPSHKENILDSNYKEIGIATLDGEFEGRKTTIIVEMFGTSQVDNSLSYIKKIW